MNSAPPRVDVNVLPDEYRQRRLDPRQVLLLAALVIVVVLTVVFYWQVLATVRQTSDLRSELAALNEQILLRRDKINERAEMVNLTMEYDSIVAKQGVLTGDLTDITTAADGVGIKTSPSTETPRVQVSSISHVGDSVVVACLIIGYQNTSGDYNAVEKILGDFCEALAETESFDSAEHEELNLPLPSAVDVDITVAAGAG